MSTIITLTLLGLILVLAEMFLPGMILGLLGVALLIAAIVVGYVEFGLIGGSMILAGISSASVIMFLLWMKYFQKTSVGRGLTLGTQLPSGNDLPSSERLVGKSGTTTTDLKPSGRATIDGERYDVLADNGYISSGENVSVVLVEGSRIVVRKSS